MMIKTVNLLLLLLCIYSNVINAYPVGLQKVTIQEVANLPNSEQCLNSLCELLASNKHSKLESIGKEPGMKVTKVEQKENVFNPDIDHSTKLGQGKTNGEKASLTVETVETRKKSSTFEIDHKTNVVHPRLLPDLTKPKPETPQTQKEIWGKVRKHAG